MQPNRIVYGAWALLLVGAAAIAVTNSRTKDTGATRPSVTSSATEPVADDRTVVNPVGFTQQKPGRLPVVSDSDPLAATKLKELRGIVEEEMPNASNEEMEVWTDELGDLPEDAVRFLLRQKAQTRNPAGLAEVSPTTMPGLHGQAVQPPPAADVFADALAIVRANLMNASTVGYRRRVIEFAGVETASSDSMGIAEVRTDVVAGPLVQTGRSLDLAIESGFFAVKEGESIYYTRAGRFSLCSERRVGLRIGTRELLLDGVQPVPEDAGQILVDKDGKVTAVGADGKTELGTIRVVDFLDASRLLRADGCLLVMSPASGVSRDIGSAEIRQGWLEQSNVHESTEQRLLESIQRWRELAR